MVSHAVRSFFRVALPCGLITYWYGTISEIHRILSLEGDNSLARTTALGSIILGLSTLISFLYVFALPWLQGGSQINFRTWRESKPLSIVIPIMTFSIVTGSTLLAISLAAWSSFSRINAVIAAFALYGLGFGIMGMIPAPRGQRKA